MVAGSGVGVEELDFSTTASIGAAATLVGAGATEEVDEVVELVAEDEVVEGIRVDGAAELQMDGGASIMPSVMVETGAPNWLTKTTTSGS